MFDIKPHSVHLKMYRVREHFESLENEIRKFLVEPMEHSKEFEKVSENGGIP